MAGIVSRLFGRKRAEAGQQKSWGKFPALSVERPFVAIGDVHGRLDLLERLLEKVKSQVPTAELVFVGDYIDRGEQSAQVLKYLSNLENAFFLLGNHERMCLDFLENPKERGPRWLRNGGLQTLASFGVSGASSDPVELQDRLRRAMGSELISWMENLPLWYKNGNAYVVHASADPNTSVEEQTEKSLIWGHPLFGEQRRGDGHWVVHGHTIVDQPSVGNGLVSIDTGAYATGRLTAAYFKDNDVELIQTK